MDFDYLVEKISNPLRKEALKGVTPVRGNREGKAEEYKDYILNGDLSDDPEYTEIRRQYDEFKKKFPQRADAWLDKLANTYANTFVRTKTKDYEKILEVSGIQVFIDNYIDKSFKDNSYNMFIIPKTIQKMLKLTTGLMPNRKPKIIISDMRKNPLFKMNYTRDGSPAFEYDRMIFIDQNYIDDVDIYIHEFAHFVAEMVSKQTNPILERAYNELLDSYWRKTKKKRVKLQAQDPFNKEEVAEAKKWRKKISEKLGFPEYGLMNFDEFFAVLIERWATDSYRDPAHRMPNNRLTYKYKSLVKDVLARI